MILAHCICGHTPCDGLDCGPYLPGLAPRKVPAPKSRQELAAIRAKAWETRRTRRLLEEAARALHGDTEVIITADMKAAAHTSAVRTATAAYLEVREAANKNYHEGACTYGEMKAAINNASYVMDAVRKLAGYEAYAVADEDAERAHSMTPPPHDREVV